MPTYQHILSVRAVRDGAPVTGATVSASILDRGTLAVIAGPIGLPHQPATPGNYLASASVTVEPGALLRDRFTLTETGRADVVWDEDWAAPSGAYKAIVHPATIAATLGIAFDAAATDPSSNSAQIAAMAEAITDAFEAVTGRLLLRRAGLSVLLDGDEIDDEGALWLAAHRPIESVTSVEAATPDGDGFVAFGAADLVPGTDWSIIGPDAESAGVGRYGLRLRSAWRLRGRRNIRLVLACGYAADDGSTGWAAPAGQAAMPQGIREAAKRQARIWWQRRGAEHQRAQGQSTPVGGTATTTFTGLALDPSVLQALQVYATAEAALAMQFPAAMAGAGGGQ